MKHAHPLVLVHGYGVRGFFWSALRTELEPKFDYIEAPDLEIPRVDDGVVAVSDLCHRVREASQEPVVLVGHSLGGVLAALAARDTDQSVVSHLVVIASPYGNRVGRAFGPFVRLRYALGMVGSPEIRRRFFGPQVPEALQRQVFDAATDESRELKALSRQRRWFHTGAFPHGVPQRSLVLASEADRIVDHRETEGFAHAIGAQYRRYPAPLGIGHNDFGMHPPAAKRTATEILRFLEDTSTRLDSSRLSR